MVILNREERRREGVEERGRGEALERVERVGERERRGGRGPVSDIRLCYLTCAALGS